MKRYADCAAAIDALARGLDEGTCHDFDGIREVVMCRAWEDFRSGRTTSFHNAVEDGWSAVRGACAVHGGITPEHGFAEAIQARAGVEPSVLNAYEVRDRTGRAVGVVVEMSDGTADACAGGACGEYPSLSAALGSLGSGVVRA